MTSWAKVLTVIAFVLSLVFAGMSAVVYAKRQAYKKMYEMEQRQHADDKAADAKKLETKEGQINDLTAVRDLLTTKVAERDKDIATLKGQIDKLTSDLADVKLNLDKEQAQVTIVTATNAELTKRYD